MSESVNRWYYFSGILAPIWLLLGVIISGSFYPEYSHYNQAMSELGAKGSPTHILSPVINNYPLGVLFIIFGFGIIKTFSTSRLARASGVLVVIHGLSSFAAGFFSCDVGCALESPSTEQNIHNISGLILFVSLLLSSLMWVFISARCLGVRWFGWFSLVCSIFSIALLPLMAGAVESGEAFGLYQRVSYGSQALWVLVFSIVLLRLKA
ncbi:DUF998 domain-containing protein [Pseudomaricurvus sp.]|uniref:DUF998 domain-containing protein n=1 Tax=Pseudomaricurvus sp. TaxID=2004510 RepID=UPI003F6AC8B4